MAERWMLTMREAAEHLGVSYDLVRAACANNELPHRRLGRRVIIHRDRLDEWARQAEGAAS